MNTTTTKNVGNSDVSVNTNLFKEKREMTIDKNLPHFNIMKKKQIEYILDHIDDMEKISLLDEDILESAFKVLPLFVSMFIKNRDNVLDKINEVIFHQDYLHDLLDSRYDYEIMKLKDETTEIVNETIKINKQIKEDRKKEIVNNFLKDIIKNNDLF